MSLDSWVLVGFGVVGSLVYFVIGLGVARMLSKLKDRPLSLIDVLLWWVVSVIFAACDDVE